MGKISVIIPTRNRQKFLLNLLSDLREQSIEDLEIVIIDQSEIPISFTAADNLIVINDGSSKGPCRARNLGISTAVGDVFVFLDDDIRIDTNFIQILCDPILKNEASAVTGAICNQNGNYLVKSDNYWRKNYALWLLSLTASPDHPGKCPTLSFPTGCSAISRAVYQKIGPFDEFFDPDGAGEDREYALRIFHAGYPILYNGEAKVRHLAAVSGGRRSEPRKGLSPLEKNSIYIVAKYFGEQVFETYCAQWRYSVLKKSIKNGPRGWLNLPNNWILCNEWINRIREIKKINGWL